MSKLIRALCLAFILSGCAWAGDWPTYGNGPAHTGYIAENIGGTMTAGWSVSIDSSQALQQVAVSNNTVFVTPKTRFGNTYVAAHDLLTGTQKWKTWLNSANSITPPTYDSGYVYVQRGNHSTDTQLWSLDAANGTTKWSAPFGAQWESYYAPCVANGAVYINGGYYGGMYGFVQATGAQKFFNSSLPQYDQWTPAYANGKVYSWVEGVLREHDPNTGVAAWSTNVGWTWNGWSMNTAAVIDGGKAFLVGSQNCYAIDLATHAKVWQVGGSVTGTPAVHNGVVYVISGMNVMALDAASGAVLITYTADTTLQMQPIVTDNALLVTSATATYLFRLGTSACLQKIPYGGFVTVGGGYVLIASGNGTLYQYTYKATPTVTWNTPTDIVYGTLLSTTQLNATANVPGTFSYSPSSGTKLNAGNAQTLTVTFTPDDTATFYTTVKTVKLNVARALPNITWAQPDDIVYGTPLSSAQTNASADIPGSFNYSPAAGAILDAGSRQLSAYFTPTDSTNYSPLVAIIWIDVLKATPSVTWTDPADIVYGTPLGATELNASASVTGSFSYSPAAGTVLNAGAHQMLSVDFFPTDSNNYTQASAQAYINVQKATPQISWSVSPIVYGTALDPSILNASANVPGSFSYTPPAGTVLNAGINQNLHADFTPTDANNYTSALANVSIDVEKAVPQISWTPANLSYGTPVGAAQLNAVANTSGVYDYSPRAGTLLPVGTGHRLWVVFQPDDTANFVGTVANALMDVTPRQPRLTWNSPADIVYGTALSPIQLNASADIPGTIVYTPAAGTVLSAGNGQTLSATFTPLDGNSAAAQVQVTLNVLKAVPQILWQPAPTLSHGQPLGAAQLNATANVAGDFVYTPAPGTILPAGNGQTLSLLFTPADTADFEKVAATATIDVLSSTSFSSPLTASPQIAKIGQPISFSAAVSTDDPVTFAWNFGDGSQASSSEPQQQHSFSSAGDYTVTLTATATNGSVATSSVTISVESGTKSTLLTDTDQDGFPDEVEISMGSSPVNAASTPWDGADAGELAPLSLTNLAVKLIFSTAGHDRIQLGGKISLPTGFSVQKTQVVVDVGGVVGQAVLDSKGLGHAGRLAFKLGPIKGTANQVVRFSAKFDAENYAETLAELLPNANIVREPRTIPVLLMLGAKTYGVNGVVSYTAKSGKSGSAKY